LEEKGAAKEEAVSVGQTVLAAARLASAPARQLDFGRIAAADGRIGMWMRQWTVVQSRLKSLDRAGPAGGLMRHEMAARPVM